MFQRHFETRIAYAIVNLMEFQNGDRMAVEDHFWVLPIRELPHSPAKAKTFQMRLPFRGGGGYGKVSTVRRQMDG